MSLILEDPEVDRLARELAAQRGSTVEEVIRTALERESRVGQKDQTVAGDRLERLRSIVARVASLPDLDTRSADEIVGYTENGLPG